MKYFIFYNCYFPELAENCTPAPKLIPPGGRSQVTRTFISPLACAKGEEDCRTTWEFFDAQADHSATSVTTY
jgi:hypothetical protein